MPEGTSAELIEHILISHKSYPHYVIRPFIPFLSPIKRVNAFVGPNNSGKSRFLRKLACEPIPALGTQRQVATTRRYIERLSNGLQAGHSIPLIEIYQELTNLRGRSFEIRELVDSLNRWTERLQIIQGKPEHANQSEVIQKAIDLMASPGSVLYTEPNNYMPSANSGSARTYIPALRGLRRFISAEEQIIEADLYAQITSKNYFQKRADRQEMEKPEVYTGYTLYEDLVELLLGNHAKRSVVRDYERFLSERFFKKAEVTLIPSIATRTITAKIGTEEHEIHDLGDGIQQIIIQTFRVFSQPEMPRLLFIEEPELFMHPGLQRALIDTFLHDPAFSKCQVFFTTHSNHIIDLAYESDNVSVFQFGRAHSEDKEANPNAEFRISRIDYTQRDVLDELGVRPTSVWFSNATIWVEGISDRFYLRKYLQLYIQEHKDEQPLFEDINYSYFEYAGANLDHYAAQDSDDARDCILVTRLCARALFVADKDSQKLRKHRKFRERFGHSYYVLRCREIENTLPVDVLRKTLCEYSKTNDTAIHVELDLDKSESKKIFQLLNRESREKLKSGLFDKSGNIHNKRDFAQRACNYLTSWDDLTPAAKELTERVWRHIKEQNKA